MPITVSQAGRKGGRTTLKKKGREFFAQIGRKGQMAMRKKYPDMASRWGRMGGRPKKPTLGEIMGENGQITPRGGHSGSASGNARLPRQKEQTVR